MIVRRFIAQNIPLLFFIVSIHTSFIQTSHLIKICRGYHSGSDLIKKKIMNRSKFKDGREIVWTVKGERCI